MKNITGIPIDVLFSIVGILIGAIYIDIKSTLKVLQNESRKRGAALTVLDTYLKLVCAKLGIPYENHHGGD